MGHDQDHRYLSKSRVLKPTSHKLEFSNQNTYNVAVKKNQSQPTYVVFDVETTGFKPEEGHVIIELAGQKFTGPEVLAEYASLVFPDRSLDPAGIAVHGITEDLLAAEGRAIQDVIPEFLDFIGDSVLIGHNVNFDLGFLNSHLVKLKKSPIINKTLDTLELARRYLILPSYSLGSVAQYLKVPQPQAHRAMADVETTRQVFLKLVERARKVGK